MIGSKASTAKPFVKWAGGKGQLLPQLHDFLPDSFENYFEPFVGGGAMFFSLPIIGSAHINDINQTLVSAYRLLQQDVELIIRKLAKLEKEYLALDSDARKIFYYAKRSEYNQHSSGIAKTVLLIFLNRTCFNGLYRENSKGEFNVPMGDSKNPRICDLQNLRAISVHLERTKITSTSYKDAVKEATEGDFVYFDPPYAPLTKTSSFTSYNKDNFGPKDQEELCNLFKELDKRGCYVMLSNSSAKLTQQLYTDFRQETVYAGRNINARGTGRGKVPELVILNY